MAQAATLPPNRMLPRTGREWRRLRHERGLRIGELAARTGLHRATIGRLEADSPHVSHRVRRIVAAALGLWPSAEIEGR